MIDTHIHLDDARYDGVREQIIQDFDKEGIDFAINASCDLATMRSGVALSQRYDKLFCTVGMHPHDSSSYCDSFESLLVEFSVLSKTVAVGEIGLDYYYDNSDRATQRDVFDRQILLSHRLGLPVMLHIRDAFGDCLDILKAERAYLGNGVLLHCYSGSAETVKQLLDFNAYFAFGGAITFAKNHKDEVLRAVPIDRLLTETDGPYLAPEPHRGRLNLPSYIGLVLDRMSGALGLPKEFIEQRVYQNALDFFPKIKDYLTKEE